MRTRMENSPSPCQLRPSVFIFRPKSMPNLTDPSVHRQREQEFFEHLTRLLQDDRLRIDTTQGRRPVKAYQQDVNTTDRAVDLKRLMTEMNRPDRELEQKMPTGQSIEVL